MRYNYKPGGSSRVCDRSKSHLRKSREPCCLYRQVLMIGEGLTVQNRLSGIDAMDGRRSVRTQKLRSVARSPRRRIRLVTVADELKECLDPVGSTRLRQPDASNGCQDHTLCRTQLPASPEGFAGL